MTTPISTDTERLRTAVEATRLTFGLTDSVVEGLARRSLALRVRGIFVPLPFVPIVRATVDSAAAVDVDVVTVANFPLGNQSLDCILLEVTAAARYGADHIDIVVPGRLVAERRWSALTQFFERIRKHAEAERGRAPVAVKAILETAAFEEDRIRGAAAAVIDAGVGWLKTSTGFHPAGGATADTVRLLREVAPAAVGVKASGAIRTRDDALTMIGAGADRIGTSAEEAILAVPVPGK